MIIAAIFFLTDGTKLLHESRSHLRTAIKYGLVSGLFIAAYTLWDRRGVAGLHMPPLLYDAGTAFTQLALPTPFALRASRRGRSRGAHLSFLAAGFVRSPAFRRKV